MKLAALQGQRKGEKTGEMEGWEGLSGHGRQRPGAEAAEAVPPVLGAEGELCFGAEAVCPQPSMMAPGQGGLLALQPKGRLSKGPGLGRRGQWAQGHIAGRKGDSSRARGRVTLEGATH